MLCQTYIVLQRVATDITVLMDVIPSPKPAEQDKGVSRYLRQPKRKEKGKELHFCSNLAVTLALAVALNLVYILS